MSRYLTRRVSTWVEDLCSCLVGYMRQCSIKIITITEHRRTLHWTTNIQFLLCTIVLKVFWVAAVISTHCISFSRNRIAWPSKGAGSRVLYSYKPMYSVPKHHLCSRYTGYILLRKLIDYMRVLYTVLAMTMVHLICIMFAHGLPDVLMYIVEVDSFDGGTLW